MSNPAWAPDEGPATIHTEDALFEGLLVMTLSYGSVMTLSVQCFVMVIRGLRKSKFTRDLPLLGYIVLIFALSTICTGTTIQYTQQAFVNYRNFPGGPVAYENAINSPISYVANTCIVASTVFSDALLLWRCMVMYQGSAIPNVLTLAIAGAVLGVEIAFSILFLISITSQTFINAQTATLRLWCFSAATNICATVVIVGRLFIHRRRLARVLDCGHVTQYTGIIAMIVESELLYTSFLILFLVPYVRAEALANVFAPSLSMVQAVASLMIVYRVLDGKGWTKDTLDQVSSFRAAQTSTIQLDDFSTLRAAGSTTFGEEASKTAGKSIQVRREVYTGNDTTGSV